MRYTQTHVKHCMLAEGSGREGGGVGGGGWGGGGGWKRGVWVGAVSRDGGRGVVPANDIEISLS